MKPLRIPVPEKKKNKFLKTIINVLSSSESWKSKYFNLESDYSLLLKKYEEKHIAEEEAIKKEYQQKIDVLEKEVVFWKEKAMNFKRFHQ